MTLSKLLPFLTWLQLINRQSLRADLIAGFTGAVIVLPQGVAFATIAGLPPEYGLYTAMVTPVIAALFGSSRHLISGPTTAISIVVFSSVSRHVEPGTPEFINLALTMTFLAGVYQFAFGLVRLGTLVNFVSHTVVIGFTAGAALLIATSQMKHVLGIEIPKGESFLHTWMDAWVGIPDINFMVLAVALATLITALLAKRLLPRTPNLLIGLIAGALVALVLASPQDHVALIGEIPAHLPPLSSPDFSLDTIRMLAPEAFAVALLGLLVLFLARTSTPEIVSLAPDPGDPRRRMRIDMSVYFGSVNQIQNRLQQIADKEGVKHILIEGSGINNIDLTGIEMLVAEAKRLKKLGGGLYFAGIKSRVYESVSRAHFTASIGNEYFFDTKSEAINVSMPG